MNEARKTIFPNSRILWDSSSFENRAETMLRTPCLVVCFLISVCSGGSLSSQPQEMRLSDCKSEAHPFAVSSTTYIQYIGQDEPFRFTDFRSYLHTVALVMQEWKLLWSDVIFEISAEVSSSSGMFPRPR